MAKPQGQAHLPAPSPGRPSTGARLRHGWSEWWHDARLGIRTGGRTLQVQRRGDGSLWKNYAPIGYRSLFAALRRVGVRPGEDVFVDYGCGKGRVVVVAATFPFRRVIGVEVRPEFAATARRNLTRASLRLSYRRTTSQTGRSGLRCPAVEIVEAGASDFGVPDDATVLHFFDPFAGTTLERLTDEIGASIRRAPRPLTILFADDHHFAELLGTRPWIRLRERLPWAHVSGERPERCSYGIYDAAAAET